MNTSVKVNDQEFIPISPNELTTQLFPTEREAFQCEGCSRVIPKARLSVHKCMLVKRKIDNVEFTQISKDKHKCELCWKEIPYILIRIHAFTHYHNDEIKGNEAEEVDERYKDMISNILKKRSQDELEKNTKKGSGNIKNEDGKENEKKKVKAEIKENLKARESAKEKEKAKEVKKPKEDAKKKDNPENNENSNTLTKASAKKNCSKKCSLENDNDNTVLDKSKKGQMDNSGKVVSSSIKNQKSQISTKKEIGNIETISLIDDTKTKKVSRKIKEEKDTKKNPANGENNTPLYKAMIPNLSDEKANKTNSANTLALTAEKAIIKNRISSEEIKSKNSIQNKEKNNKEFIGSMIKSLSKSDLKEIYTDYFQGYDKKDSATETIRKVRITESKLNRLVYVQNRFFTAKVHHGFRKMHKNLMDFYV